MGVITFFASPYFQYSGLSRSTSTANAIIVALEPLFAVLLAWIFLREKMAWRQLLAFFFAVFGFCLLSNLRPDKWNESLNLFNTGNILLMLALPCEAMYSIISRRLGSDFSPVIIFSVALTFGFACFSFYLFFVRGETLPNFQLLQGKKLIALLWMGPVGTTISYMFWTYALRKASVAVVSLTLFIQPIQGALVGTFFLGDRLDIFQSVGAILILAALTTQSLPYLRKAPI
jgi:drug/metabolite transporter (DMT)-like permease